jgi:Domain of unknown function (DUF6438)
MRALAISIALLIVRSGAFAVPPPHIDSITLARTACYGSCPVYSVTVRSNGTVTYHGEYFVKVKGRRSHRIPSSGFRQLADEVRRIGFFAFQSHYKVRDKHPDGTIYDVSDLPSAITTVQAGKLRKRVVRYGEYDASVDPSDIDDSPEGLRRLEHLIDKISGSAAWVGDGT